MKTQLKPSLLYALSACSPEAERAPASAQAALRLDPNSIGMELVYIAAGHFLMDAREDLPTSCSGRGSLTRDKT